jgi:uncharacterized membrane protein
MTDTTLAPTAKPHEDRVLPAVTYGLYAFAAPSGLITLIIGLVLAYANRASAGPRAASHYQFLIQTFWKSIWWILIGCALIVVGVVLTVTVVLAIFGIPAMIIGGVILAAVGLWFYARCIVGAIYLVQDEPYPRPDAWLI